MAPLPNNEYAMIYRRDEEKFIGVRLDRNLDPIPRTHFSLDITNCADPRLLSLGDGRILMVYSSLDVESSHTTECIRAGICMTGQAFVNAPTKIVSPRSLRSRQKNWMPFMHEGTVYLVASTCPHVIFELIFDGPHPVIATQRYTTQFLNPWPILDTENKPLFLRGNTNAVRLDDGNYLSTFHTAQKIGHCTYYDNGCAVFEGEPPFRVLRCGNRTYLPADAACEPHFRKAGLIVTTFPCGMVREGNDLLISYGDNDSAVKIMRTTVQKMLETTVPVRQV